MVLGLNRIKNLITSPQILVKVQTKTDDTLPLLIKLHGNESFNQQIVDPQSPKQQARIQQLKDYLEESYNRLGLMSFKMGFDFSSLPTLEEEDYSTFFNLNKLDSEIRELVENKESQINSLYDRYQELLKEERILSALAKFKGEVEENELSLDMLSSGSRTFTLLGEIPTSYEELIRFYIKEISADNFFFWSTTTNDSDRRAIICVSTNDYKSQIEDVLKENHFDTTKLDLSDFDSIDKIKKTASINKLYSKVGTDLEQAKKELENITSKLKDKILYKISLLYVAHDLLTMEEKGRTSEKTLTLWGWIKKKQLNDFTEELKLLSFEVNINELSEVPFAYKKSKSEGREELTISAPKKLERGAKHIPTLSHRGLRAEGGFLFAKKSSFVKFEAPEEYSRQFISLLLSLNAVHPIKIGSQNPGRTEKINSQRIELTQYLARIKKIIDLTQFETSEALISKKYELVDQYIHSKAFIENFLQENEEKILSITSERNQIQKKIEQIKLSLPFEEQFNKEDLEISLFDEGFQTITKLGTIPKSQAKAVRFFLVEVTDGNVLFRFSEPKYSKGNEKHLIVLSLKEYEPAILRVLGEYSFQEIEIDTEIMKLDESLEELIEELNTGKEKLDESLEEIYSSISERLAAVNEIIEVELERIRTEEICQTMEDKITLWGWIPADKIDQILKANEEVKFELKITFTEKVPLMSPSITKRGKFMGAIRGLIGGIGEPNPHEVDPYSIVKYTFPLLFGLMFADLGHGLILALIGGFFLYKKKKNKIEPDESMSGYIYSGAELLIVCGLTSAFMGVLFGSFFGDEELLPEFFHGIGVDWIPLISPLHETQLLLTFSILVGFVILQLGILLKFIQNMKYGHGIASKIAPASLSLVYVGIFSVLYSIIVGDGLEVHSLGIRLPNIPSNVMTVVIIIMAIMLPVLFISEYIHAKVDGILDGIDHIIALISNTLSFSRLMALLLVHAILSGLPFRIIDGLEPLSVLWWVSVLLMSLIIVPLEGLLSFLNSLRLTWVEFFSKFYVGNGLKYEPITEKTDFIHFVSSKGL